MGKADSPGVHVPPPLMFAGIYAVGLMCQRFVIDLEWSSYFEVPGLVLVGLGLLLMFVSIGVFWSRRTTILPNRSATKFVVAGPYRFTRNPMYLGMSLAYTGLSFAFGPVWPFLLLPFAVIWVSGTVIAREETYLLRTFGEPYEQYCARVRRWI